MRLDPGTTRVEVAPGPSAALSLRRFASKGYPVSVAMAGGGSTTLLWVPRDEAPQKPWYLHVQTPQDVRVCP